MSTTQTGTCACGATVDRPTLDGPFAEIQATIPFLCEPCIDREETLERQESKEREAKLAAEHYDIRLKESDLPKSLRRVDLDKLDPAGNEEAFEAARRWARRDISTLVLTGSFGTGKTTLAAGAFNLAFRTMFVAWVSAPELLMKLNAGFGEDERAQAMGALLGHSGLVLDDIDKIRPSAYGAEQLFIAIDHCLQNERPLIVTTNLKLSEMASRYPDAYGEAIASRLGGFDEGHRIAGRDRRLP